MSSHSLSSVLRVILIAANIVVPLITLYIIQLTADNPIVSVFNQNLSLIRIGSLAGSASAFVFIILSCPGILRRFRVGGFLKTIQLSLMPVRAHLGVLMFLLAFVHYLLVKIVPTVRLSLPVEFQLFENFGFSALFLSFPLAITSTRWMKKHMKRTWQKVHNATYLILWLIFAHVALVGEAFLAVLLAITGVLQILSLIIAGRKK